MTAIAPPVPPHEDGKPRHHLFPSPSQTPNGVSCWEAMAMATSFLGLTMEEHEAHIQQQGP